MIDWNKRNGGFLSPESVYEDQLGNLSMQINNLQQQLDKYKNVIEKIKEEVLSELQMCKPKEMAISMEINYIEEKLEKLLEEINE